MSVPLWLALAIVLIVLGIVALVRDADEGGGGYMPSFPVLGALAFLASIIAALVIYVFHLKGWLFL